LARITNTLLPTTFRKVSWDYKIQQFLEGHAYSAPRAHQHWRSIFNAADLSALLKPEIRDVVMSEDPFSAIEPHFRRVESCHFLDQALYVDFKTWLVDDILVKIDRASMAHSLEVRAPLLDHRVVEFAAALPIEMKLHFLRKKHVLKESQRNRLPNNIIDRPKSGFNTPVSEWLNGGLRSLAYSATTNSAMEEWFDGNVIQEIWDQHMKRKRDNGYRLFGLACLGLWMEQKPGLPPEI
jgi:asparagine synthase (glutamine-hydrolysing)